MTIDMLLPSRDPALPFEHSTPADKTAGCESVGRVDVGSRSDVCTPIDQSQRRDQSHGNTQDDESGGSLRLLPPALRHDLKNEVVAMSLGLSVVIDEVREGRTESALEVLESLMAQMELVRKQCSVD